MMDSAMDSEANLVTLDWTVCPVSMVSLVYLALELETKASRVSLDCQD